MASYHIAASVLLPASMLSASPHGSLGTPRLVRPVRGDPGPPHPTGAFLAGGHEGVWGRVNSPLRPLSPCADYVHSPVALGLAPVYGFWWSTRTMGLLLNPKGALSALAEPRSPSLRPSVFSPGEGPVGSVSAKARGTQPALPWPLGPKWPDAKTKRDTPFCL